MPSYDGPVHPLFIHDKAVEAHPPPLGLPIALPATVSQVLPKGPKEVTKPYYHIRCARVPARPFVNGSLIDSLGGKRVK